MFSFRAIHQIAPTLAFGDAIGNHVLALRQLLREWGYASEVFAQHWDPRFDGLCHAYTAYSQFSNPGNLLLFHYSIGSAVNDFVASLPDRVVLYYHNITPAHFFYKHNSELARLVEIARRDLPRWASRAPALAGSQYNARELNQLGFDVLGVVPYALALRQLDADLRAPAARNAARQFGKTDSVDWLYVGRLSPNKCIHDLIQAFHYYHSCITRNSRLLLVGAGSGMENYVGALYQLVTRLRLDGRVAFVGSVESPAPFYAMADIFITLSEHEGFCVPLLEAMQMNVPVLAFASTAIPETLGQAGILFRRKDFPLIAEVAHEVIRNETLRLQLLSAQRAQLAAFTPEIAHAQLRASLEALSRR